MYIVKSYGGRITTNLSTSWNVTLDKSTRIHFYFYMQDSIAILSNNINTNICRILPDWFSFIPFYLRYIYIESLVRFIRALTWPTAERQMPGPNQGRSLHHLCLVYKQQLVHNNESVQKKFNVIVKLAYLIQIKISGMNNRITIWKCIIKQRFFFYGCIFLLSQKQEFNFCNFMLRCAIIWDVLC